MDSNNLSICPKFKALSVEQRLSEVQKHKLCFCCLRADHWLSNCPHPKQCGVNGCTRTYNALLHSLRNVTSMANSEQIDKETPIGLPEQRILTLTVEPSRVLHGSSNASALLQVVPVTVYGPNGYFNTYAMLDTGSTCSLLDAAVAGTLGLDGPVEKVLLNGIQKTSELLTRRVNLQVGPLKNSGTRYDVNGVLVVNQLNVPERKLNLKEVQDKWPHLSDIELTEVAGTQVTLLLGSDVPELIVPLETRCGPNGSPIGIRTKIGWTITGRLPGYIQDCESVCKVHVTTPDEELNETVKTSLNSLLLSGPDMLNNLVGILMRFREEKIALSGDIEAMFNQVAVPPEDQVVLRFLWRQSSESETEVYQYLRHIFGAKCAPTCSNYALVRSAEDNEEKFPGGALAVKRNFYMDDFFKSVKSSEEALALQKQLVEMLKLSGFKLTKWISNDRNVIDCISESERADST